MSLRAGQKIYFMGIAGTGMASVAGLCKEAGYEVAGSDANVYPPMSTMLAELGIPVATPYDPANLGRAAPELVVIANSLSRAHAELEHAMQKGLPYTSFAALVGEAFLKHAQSLVVCGTHGKTTTSSLLAHTLYELGEDPSFLIGGIPRNFPRSFRLGGSKLFVIEGDEYDTAFFDKESKFLHYAPDFVLFNNLEFDHADIFKDLAAVEAMFAKLLRKVALPRQIIANVDDPGVAKLLDDLGLRKEVFTVASRGEASADLRVLGLTCKPASQEWIGLIQSPRWGRLELSTRMAGPHNMANIAQVLGCLTVLADAGLLQGGWGVPELLAAFASFRSVKRRLDYLGSHDGVELYEDFAHHPTAVDAVIRSFRLAHPDKRLIVAFEPRNASSRRKVFSSRYVEVLGQADLVLMGACPPDLRIPEAERMRTDEIAAGIGTKALAFNDNEELYAWAKGHLRPNDALIFMSCGSFSGIPARLAREFGLNPN